MGVVMQLHGQSLVVMNAIIFGMNSQTPLHAPMSKWLKGNTVEVEHRFYHHIADLLTQKGHDIQYNLDPNRFGWGQIIWRDPETGVLIGGSESRTDGTVATW